MSLLSWFQGLFSAPSTPPTEQSDKTSGLRIFVASYGYTRVYRDGDASRVFWTGKADIDADGSPRAYNPQNSGLDDLSSAGHTGNWWGVVTSNERPSGNPVVQSNFDPHPGYYVSPTALVKDATRHPTDPLRYYDAETERFIVIPGGFPIKSLLGKRCRVTYNGKSAEGVVADVGPEDKIGEVSIAMAVAVGIPSSPRHGGVSGGVTYEIFL